MEEDADARYEYLSGAADTDGDALSDGDEWGTVGTDPTDPDSDGDTMEDGWEWRYALDPTSAADASGNPDGDPHDNVSEHTADTDPTDAASHLRVIAITRVGAMRVHFLSSAERVYTLERRDAPAPWDGWAEVPGQARLPGVGGQDWLTDTNAAGNAVYRVGVEKP